MRDPAAWEAEETFDLPTSAAPPRTTAAPPAREVRPPVASARPSPAAGDVTAARRFHRSLRAAGEAEALAGPPPSSAEAEAGLWDRLARSSPHPVGLSTRQELAEPGGAAPESAATAAKVHDDATADALARRHGADAVTRGDRVAFRLGGYRPESPAGRALLGHELVHVARRESAPGDDGSRRDEEHAALSAERRASAALRPRSRRRRSRIPPRPPRRPCR